MAKSCILFLFVPACCALGSTVAIGDELSDLDPSQVEFFESKIRPVLISKCYECHSAGTKAEGGLMVDSRQALAGGGDLGNAVVPGDVESSLILSALRYEDLEMPPDSKLPDHVIQDFEKWIDMGAPDPREQAIQSAPPSTIDIAGSKSFWAFQPPRRHTHPQVSDPQWISNAIDPFVLNRLDEQGLNPNPPADRSTLIRRLSFDLIGLPPTPSEVSAFIDDPRPDATTQLIMRLIQSPQFGERWARMWLDIARYAEDQAHIVGNDQSLFYPNAFRYRDWVIQAFNTDLPYDRFVRLQLAADIVAPDHRNDLAALGFIGLGPKYYRRSSPEVMADEWEDRVDVVGRGLLGLTVACARCHDHKYDPIPSEDYYALAGVFASSEMFNYPMTEDCELNKKGEAKDPGDSFHILRESTPVELNLLIRGDINARGPVVSRHFLQILSEAEPTAFDQGSGRRQLAEAIVDRRNPLTARVFVNRVWNQLFGKGLVATPSNLGALGSPPTHPQLLDDLASRFMDEGWSIKWLVREIVSSSTYQQSSSIQAQASAVDPTNQLYWRMDRRRLSAEAWRDAVLAASGSLDSRVGGESIDIQSTDETRRTLYTQVSRLKLDSFLAAFDFPDPNVHSARRVETTTPLQKLFVMNSSLVMHHARRLAEKIKDESESETVRIAYAYRLLFGRSPSPSELELGREFVDSTESDPDDGWTQYAQVLLASNEFLMLD